MITFENVSKNYPNGVNALNGINFHVDTGEFVFIIGASGAGKSTIMKLILKEEKQTKGSIVIDGIDLDNVTRRTLPEYRRNVGIVFQDFRLLSDKTVYENIAFAMEIVGKKKSEIKKRVPELLKLVGLEDQASRFPNQLSGGEHQRVAIARAVANEPKILIADEPTGNLDPATANEIMKVFKEINCRNTTVLMCTHDRRIVDEMETRVLEINNGEIIRDEEKGRYHCDI